MSEPSLNERVLQYQRDGRGLQELMEEIAPRVYSYPLSKFGFDEDDCGEYFLFVYPRLLRTLARFQERGRPFEWYLNSVLRWQLGEYRRLRRASEERWAAATQPGFWERPAVSGGGGPEDTDPGPVELLRKVCGTRGSRAAGRRILFWALKHPRRLAGEDIQALAEVSGLEESFVEEAVRAVEQSLHQREERLRRLHERRNRAYARCLHLQGQLCRELDRERRRELRARLDKARNSLHRTAERLSRVRAQPSNREIARALRVPKGTVDSSLFWLRRRLTRDDRRCA
ncbi:MAG: hypothetical protein JW820_01495 [Spirochaetales bacterium]|nr:hypothetical protein [Spirochaetales bacterium]